MKRQVLKRALPVLTVACLLGTPLVSPNQIALFTLRLLGSSFGIATCLTKTEDELSWLQQEQQRLDREKDELSKRYIADTEILEQWVKDEEKRLENAANERIKENDEKLSLLVEDALDEAERWQSLYLETKQQLEGYLLPRKPTGTSRLEVVSARIIDFLYQHGVLADYEDCWTENEYDLVRIKPRSGGKEQFLKLADEMQLELQLNKQPTFNISQGCIQIRLETYGVDTRTTASKPSVLEPSDGFLSNIIEAFYSFRVNGESGSGKSTFVRNLLKLMGQDKTDVVLIDPKYPMSEWDINPKFKGIEEGLDGLIEAATEVEQRLSLARQDKDNGKAIRNFKPILYVIDEIDWVVTHYGQEAANQLRTTLKVGRALNVRLLYIGQTPLASRLKMNRDDFRHSANFFLGENIPAAIEETCLSSTLKADLEAQYILRQHSTDRYHMLVKVPGKQPYLAKLPKPLEFPLGNGGTAYGTVDVEKAELENGYNPQVPVNDAENERNSDFSKNGTERNSEQNTVPVSSQTVPGTVPDSSSQISENMAKTALQLLEDGVSKGSIIKDYWGYKGRRYQLGKDLWTELGLPDINE